MIDIKVLMEQSELVAQNNKKRGKDIDVSVAQGLQEKRLSILEEIQVLRTRANEVAELIPKAENRDVLVKEGKALKDQVKQLEATLAQTEIDLAGELRRYPNLLRDDVPVGLDETGNQIMRTFGEPTAFSFEPKDHLDLGIALGIIDMDRAAKVSGARFTYVKGDGVLLELALLQYAISETTKAGFTPVLPPHLVSTKAMSAMGYLEHGGEEEIYHLKHDELVLIGTAEQSIGPMHMDEILDAEQLPLRYVGFSPCYRREAGSYGRDTHGILRVHQFDKVEMFSFTTPERSDEEHEFLLSIQERLMQGLNLSHRVMKLCSGDTGSPSARTYDIETWMPSQKTYRETSSTSNTTDFQTRRLNTRVKVDKKNVLAHALNGSVFAMGRTIIAILENYQQEDGSIIVPNVLRPWLGKDVIHKHTDKKE